MGLFSPGAAKQRLKNETATIAAADATGLSGEVRLGGRSLTAIVMPAAWDAAVLTFKASQDGATFLDVYDGAGLEVSVVVAASRYVLLDASAFRGLEAIQIRSGTSGTPVTQSAARSLVLLAREVE